MPMKCIVHTPIPMATAPAESQTSIAIEPFVALILSDMPKAPYEAREAIRTDRMTRKGS